VPPILYGCRQAVLTFMRSDRLGPSDVTADDRRLAMPLALVHGAAEQGVAPTIGRGRPLAGERQGVGQTGLRAANPLALDPS